MLKTLFNVHGRQEEIAGNQALNLCQQVAVARVESGHLDCFVTRLDAQGRGVGRQRCLASLGPGELFFLHPGFCSITGLLARAAEETVISSVALAQVPNDLLALIGASLDHWALRLAAFIAPRISARAETILSAADHEVELPTGQARLLTAGRETVRWLARPSGVTRLEMPGYFELEYQGDVPLPLCPVYTVQVVSPAGQTVPLLDGQAVLRIHGPTRAVEAFARFCSATAARRLDWLDREDEEHYRYQARFDQMKWRLSIGYMAGLVDSRQKTTVSSVRDDDPLQVVVEQVIRQMGSAFTPPDPLEYQSDETPLNLIARANGLRVHTVRLRDGWFTQEAMPMLGWYGKARQPVALLPHGKRHLKAHFPDQRSPMVVTGKTAGEFAPEAIIFFRPLPPRSLTVKDLLRLAARACRQERLVILVSGLLAALIGLLTPIITSEVMNQVVPSNDLGYLYQIALGLVVAALASTIFELFKAVSLMRVNFKGEMAMQPGVWDRLLRLPLTFFRHYSAGDLANRANSAIEVSNQLKGTIVSTALAGIFAAVNFMVMFHFDAKLAFCGLGLAAVAYVVIGLLTWKQYRAARQLFDIQGQISGMVLQFTSGISKLKAAGAEWRAYEHWARMFSRQKELDYRSKGYGAAQETFAKFFDPFSKMIILALLLYHWKGVFNGGQYAAFSAAMGAFISAILAMATVMPFLAHVALLFKRLEPVLTAEPEVTTSGRTDPGILSGALELQGATFRYIKDGPLVLQGVSLQAAPGEFIAIVGGSGSGKSTVFRVLLGFEALEAGEVFYDGMGLGQLDVELVRKQLGVVLQDGNMMPGDIYTNIAGGTDITIDEAWAAIRQAGLEHDIKDMPMGIFTVISEGARTFSGGQKQPLMIARALARRPRLLLFDEATSALDNATQRIVANSLDALNITRVIIAHRLSTVMHAHRIYVMEHGRLTQVGSYEQLMAQDGWFRNQARRQRI